MPSNLFAVGVGQETAQQLDRPRCIQMHSGSEGERLVVQSQNIGQGNQKTMQHTWIGQERWEQEMKSGKQIAELSFLDHSMNA